MAEYYQKIVKPVIAVRFTGDNMEEINSISQIANMGQAIVKAGGTYALTQKYSETASPKIHIGDWVVESPGNQFVVINDIAFREGYKKTVANPR